MQIFSLSRLAAIFIFSFLCTLPAHAFKADPLKGEYEILSGALHVEGDRKPIPKAYFIVDTDLLAKIWAKYAQSPLPADLVPYKDEPSIIVGFTARDFVLLSLERTALISPTYMRLQGAGDTLLEMQRRPDGQSDLAVQENGRLSKYLLAAPTPLAPTLDSVQKEFAFYRSLER